MSASSDNCTFQKTTVLYRNPISTPGPQRHRTGLARHRRVSRSALHSAKPPDFLDNPGEYVIELGLGLLALVSEDHHRVLVDCRVPEKDLGVGPVRVVWMADLMQDSGVFADESRRKIEPLRLNRALGRAAEAG